MLNGRLRVRATSRRSRGSLASVTSGRATVQPGTRHGARPVSGRPRDPDADRAILEATWRLLIDIGYDATSIERVAAEAGVAKTTIYRRYPTKRDLVVAALAFETPFDPSFPADADTPTVLGLLVRQILMVLVAGNVYAILPSILVADRRDPGLLEILRERIIGPRRAVLVDVIQRGIARREVRPDADPMVVTEMLAGAVFAHQVVLAQPTSDAWLRGLVDHLWQAIRAREPEDRSRNLKPAMRSRRGR